jgi:hypothetical protein
VSEPTPGPEGDAAAQTSPDPRDRRGGERRSGADRRAGTTPPAGVERRQGDRRGTDRRRPAVVPDQYRGNVRSINEYPLDGEELEFINAINAYKQHYSRPFPTWSEVLHVLKFLGYRRPAGAAPPAPGSGPEGGPAGRDAR